MTAAIADFPAAAYITVTGLLLAIVGLCWGAGWLALRFLPRLAAAWTTRGEAADVPDDFDQDVDDAVLLTHEEHDEEETNKTAADFVLWDAEVGERSGVHKYLRRMERGSR